MANEDVKNEILDWLQSETPDTSTGLALWGKYGKNRALDRMFYRSPDKNMDKLKYELAKIAGFTFANFEGGVFKADAPAKTEVKKQLPAIILRIFEEIKILFAQLTSLNKELVELPEGNDTETVARAAELGEQIDALNTRHEELHAAKEEYFKNGVMPDEAALFPIVDASDPYGFKTKSGAELMKIKGNLESSLSKDRNLLLYQNKKKQEVEDPMPEGEQRTAVEERIKLKVAQINDIISILDAGKTE